MHLKVPGRCLLSCTKLFFFVLKPTGLPMSIGPVTHFKEWSEDYYNIGVHP